MKNAEIKSRIDAHKTDRTAIEAAWTEVDRYVMPFRGGFLQAKPQQEQNTSWKARDHYDSTAPDAAQGLAASLHGSLTSMVTRWFDLRFGSEELNDSTEAKKWLEAVGTLIFETLQVSNFNLEASEAYMDLVGYGNSALMEEVDGDYTNFKALSFKALPLRGCYFDQDVDGAVINFYRIIEWTPLQMVDKFGKEAVPLRIVEASQKAKQAGVKEDVYFCIFKRKLGTFAQADTAKPSSEELRPYGYKYIVAKEMETIKDGGYYEMPVFVPRWRKTTGSHWGYSPAMVSMGDIITMNQLKQLVLTAGEKAVDPPSLVNQRGVVGDVDLRAGGKTVVKSDAAIKPYESGAKFDVSQIIQADLQAAIRRAFFADQLELKESPAMTATEVSVRYELMQRLLGPTLGRLQNDFLKPLISRTYYILARAGRLPQMPDVLQQMHGETAGFIKVEYIGPLSRSQKLDEVASVQRWLSLMMTISQVKPEVLDTVDWDIVGKDTAQLSGVPMKYLASKKKIKEVRDARQAEQAEQKQMMMAQAQAQTLKDAGAGVASISQMTAEQGMAA